MNPAAPPVITVHGLEPELLLEGIRGARLEPCLLSASPALSQLARFTLPSVSLDFATLGPTLQFTGEVARDRYTLVYVHASPTPSRAFNFAMQHGPGMLGLFSPGGVVDAVTAPGYANMTLTLPVKLFHETTARHFPELPETWLRTGIGLHVGKAEQARLRQIITQSDRLMRETPALLARPEVQRHLERSALAAFLAALRSGYTQPDTRDASRRGHRFHRMREARDFLATRARTPLYIDDLCQALRLSERGVEKLFGDLFGVSPIAYLRHHRLHGVRRALLQSEPAPGLVKQAALEWGFWHLGHFARDYRQLFAESPRETLLRGR